MNLAIVQIGLKRFYDVSLEHHKDFYSKLSETFNIKVYDYYRTEPDPECPYLINSNEIQLYDFLKSKNKIREDVFIKIRSDIFITKVAQNLIIEKIKQVFNQDLDLCFLGYDGHFSYKKPFIEAKQLLEKKKVVDHIIIARKDKIPNDLNFISKLEHDRIKSGNTGFYHLINDSIKYQSIGTQIYVIRKNYDVLNQHQILLDWKSLYPKKWKEQIKWIKKNKSIIESF